MHLQSVPNRRITSKNENVQIWLEDSGKELGLLSLTSGI